VSCCPPLASARVAAVTLTIECRVIKVKTPSRKVPRAREGSMTGTSLGSEGPTARRRRDHPSGALAVEDKAFLDSSAMCCRGHRSRASLHGGDVAGKRPGVKPASVGLRLRAVSVLLVRVSVLSGARVTAHGHGSGSLPGERVKFLHPMCPGIDIPDSYVFRKKGGWVFPGLISSRKNLKEWGYLSGKTGR
jgi:hypothetical protein